MCQFQCPGPPCRAATPGSGRIEFTLQRFNAGGRFGPGHRDPGRPGASRTVSDDSERDPDWDKLGPGPTGIIESPQS